jgi:hypothetical protein
MLRSMKGLLKLTSNKLVFIIKPGKAVDDDSLSGFILFHQNELFKPLTFSPTNKPLSK